MSAAGRNASGRGAPAWGGGDSRAGGRGSRRGKAECARCLTSLWYRWTGRGAATMTTSRGSVGWTTGSAPSEKTQTVRARLERALTGMGEPATRGPRSHRHLVRACTRRCGPTLLVCAVATPPSLRRAGTIFLGPSRPSSSLAGHGRGLQTWPTEEVRPVGPPGV